MLQRTAPLILLESGEGLSYPLCTWGHRIVQSSARAAGILEVHFEALAPVGWTPDQGSVSLPP